MDLFAGVGHMLGHPFMRNAFEAGTGVAVAAGLVGYFVVLRSQLFTGDALSHVAFTGALAALAAGLNLQVGLYGGCVVFALVLAMLGPRGRADDTVIGSAFAWVLGLGALLLTVYTTSQSGGNGTAGISVLFGTIFGLSGAEATTAALVGVGIVVVVVAVGRPLLFATVDEDVAAARGVPTRALGVVFLVLVGVTAGAATQAVGALLLLGLLAAPAGAAQLLTARPYRAMWISAAIAVASMWVGLWLSYVAPQVPPSFGVLAVATGIYAGVVVVTRTRRRARRTGHRVAPAALGLGAGR